MVLYLGEVLGDALLGGLKTFVDLNELPKTNVWYMYHIMLHNANAGTLECADVDISILAKSETLDNRLHNKRDSTRSHFQVYRNV